MHAQNKTNCPQESKLALLPKSKNVPLIIANRLMDQPNVGGVQLAALGALGSRTVLAPDASDSDLSDDDGGLVATRAVLGRQVLRLGGKVFDLGAQQTQSRGEPLGVGWGGEQDGRLICRGRGGCLCLAASGFGRHVGECRLCG